MSLQRLRHELQKPLKIFEAISFLIDEIEGDLDRSPLSVLHKFLISATDKDINQLVFFLFRKSVFPFLEMLGKWIYYGLIEDDFQEFMIKEINDDAEDQVENFDWDERFELIPNRVPKFF